MGLDSVPVEARGLLSSISNRVTPSVTSSPLFSRSLGLPEGTAPDSYQTLFWILLSPLVLSGSSSPNPSNSSKRRRRTRGGHTKKHLGKWFFSPDPPVVLTCPRPGLQLEPAPYRPPNGNWLSVLALRVFSLGPRSVTIQVNHNIEDF
jgi:hypothetical protein